MTLLHTHYVYDPTQSLFESYSTKKISQIKLKVNVHSENRTINIFIKITLRAFLRDAAHLIFVDRSQILKCSPKNF